jgi:L-2-hydroxyglutarate oxidase LhgO
MQRIGKVIVASTPEDVPTVKKLYERARANGIRADLVDERRLKEIEPEAKTCEIALYSPDTAIIDSKATLQAIAKEVLASGVTVIKSSGTFRIHGQNIHMKDGPIAFGHLINAAGLHADSVAHAMGTGEHYSILPFKGIYRRLRPELAPRFRGLIYPAPDLTVPFLGIHTVKTTAGDVMAGPTAIPAFGRENYGVLSGIDLNSPRIALDLAALFLKNTGGFRKMMWQEVARYDARNFLKAVQALVPFLRREDLLGVGKIGLRAQLFDRKKKKLVMDFVIEDGPHSTHILNAISPAFTSSLAFAEVVADRVLARR